MNYKKEAIEKNELLMKDCDSIDPKVMKNFEKTLKGFCEKRNFQESYTEAVLSHRYRYFLTIEKIKELLQKGSKFELGIEMGGDGPFSDLLKFFLPEITWTYTKGDLRGDWGVKRDSLDLILSTEVVEHLSDIPEGFQDTFYHTGLIETLKESYKSLKKGGILFITTPNAASVNVITNVLAGAAPWFFPLHVREYTKNDLITKLEEQGFEIVSANAVHCMSYPLNINWICAFEALLTCGYDCSERGDDLFIICKKPS